MFTFTDFKHHVLAAIRKYEARFSANKPMNAHRAQDVLALRYTLATDTSGTIDELMFKLDEYLQTIKTGWWIFKTGNSRLKDNINDVFNAYKNPLLRAAHASLSHISESYDTLKETLDAIKQFHPEATSSFALPESRAIPIPKKASTQVPPRLWDSVRDESAPRLRFFTAPADDREEPQIHIHTQTQADDTLPSLVVNLSKSYF